MKSTKRKGVSKKLRRDISRGFLVTDPDLDAPDGEIVGAFERCGEQWVPLPRGTKISMDVTWPNGQTINMTGELEYVKDGECFMKTDLGYVVGSADTVEKL